MKGIPMSRILPVLLILAGCAAQAEDKRPTYTEALESFRSEVASVNATLGNNTAELEGVKEELKAVRAGVGRIEKLLSVDTEISIEVPKAADPPSEKTEPKFQSGVAPVKAVTLHGKPLDVAAVIKSNYHVRWTHPGTIDSHLQEHGVAGFEGLDNETKEKLHSALHEMGESPSKAIVKQRAVVTLPMASGGCPNGRCPLQQQAYYTSRSRLFGRR